MAHGQRHENFRRAEFASSRRVKKSRFQAIQPELGTTTSQRM